MAAYNGAQFLSEQLASLASQTRRPDELVVVDDGSQDCTLQLLEKFSRTAPFDVRVFSNSSNLGYAQNFGKALSLCRGDIIFPCDQDDWWFDEKIATMLNEFSAYPETCLLFCNAIFTDEDLRPAGMTKLGQIRANGLSDHAHVMGCCMAVRADLLQLALPVPKSVRGHDNWIAQIADELSISRRLEKPLQYYRLHGRNASDFFVNRVGRPSLADQLFNRTQRFVRRFAASNGMEEEQNLLREVAFRLDARQERAATFAGRERLGTTNSALAERIKALDARVNVRRSPRTKRLAPIISLWRAGGYRGRFGIARAMKDLLIVVPSENSKQE